MSGMSQIISFSPIAAKKIDFSQPTTVKKFILIAIATLMTLGMALSYFLGAPWFVAAGFFLFAISPLFPLGKVIDDQKSRIIE